MTPSAAQPIQPSSAQPKPSSCPFGSAVPGVREVIDDGRDGRLVAESDPQALADALEQLLRSPEEAARLGAAARAKAIACHSRELMNQRYEEMLLSLVNGSATKA